MMARGMKLSMENCTWPNNPIGITSIFAHVSPGSWMPGVCKAKLKLYSRRGVVEYWIVSWQERLVELYRREDAALKLVSTLYENDVLQSPLLPGFACQVSLLFAGVI